MESLEARISIDNYILRLETDGEIDRACKTCQAIFIPKLKLGIMLTSIFAPRHKASSRCRSGGYHHCTCDTCF